MYNYLVFFPDLTVKKRKKNMSVSINHDYSNIARVEEI